MNFGVTEKILVATLENGLFRDVSSAISGAVEFIRGRDLIASLKFISENDISAVIADIDFDGNSGLNILKAVRRNKSTRLIPFILLSREGRDPEGIAALENGADAYLNWPFAPGEFDAVVKSKLNLFRELYQLSVTDELTKLSNRREFIRKISDLIEYHSGQTFSLSILDIDNFKNVNDSFGHQTGDEVLRSLADILINKTSPAFFPARFGGEEFVILFPEYNIYKSKIIMEQLLREFSAIEFASKKETFSVTFSAGIAEYPAMASNASELLSRADQALYTSKADGKNRVYNFSPMMARNDRFWNYLKAREGFFVDGESRDSITHLPFINQILETIYNLQFEVKAAGVILIRPEPVYAVPKYSGFKNYHYDIENMKKIIERACDRIFPTDTFIGLTDFFNYEFIIIFPSAIDYSFNAKKFQEICTDISNAVLKGLSSINIDISYSCGIVHLDKNNPRKIFSDIKLIATGMKNIGEKSKLKKFVQAFNNIDDETSLPRYIVFKKVYSTESLAPELTYISLKKPFAESDLFSHLANECLDTNDRLISFFSLIAQSLKKERGTLVLPWIVKFELPRYIQLLKKIIPGRKIIITINENFLLNMNESLLLAAMKHVPQEISFGVGNCFISGSILRMLSTYQFELLVFSPNIVRNIHLFKDRMKVISGLQVFLEQLEVLSAVLNVAAEEELRVVKDLGIPLVSGRHIDKIIK